MCSILACGYLGSCNPTCYNRLPVDPVIVLATDLTPSQTVQLDASVVRGIVTERGSATSHSAILARSLGIPAVVGIGKDIKQIVNDHALAIDGSGGKVWLEPDTNTRSST